MPHEVIMPALGMAQDTGLIVAWHKEPGDKVAAGEVLMEVETDKSVMEVEAGHDGYVAELRAAAGDNVPVGEVVAVITADKPDAAAAPKPAEKPAEKAEAPAAPDPGAAPAAAAPQPAEPRQAPAPKPQPAPVPAPAGRILASPKAKRLAGERGLDLKRLAAAGRRQPYHVADLDHLAGMAASAGARDRFEARVAGGAFAELLSWFAEETADAGDSLAVLAAFAAASLRAATDGADGPLVIAAEQPAGRRNALYADPDLYGLAAIAPAQAGTPALVLRDLTGTRLSAMRLAGDGLPVMSVSRDGDAIVVALDAAAGAPESEQAITLMNEMAARIETPLRHLL
jgi:pyruvate/2-oxoglutarate dehydrogenase complex dihydrolipoamide acyltransferase (E2) component